MDDFRDFFPYCESCMYYSFYADTGDAYCTAAFDEDDIAVLLYRKKSVCPFYRGGNEYDIVKKQL